MTITKETVEHVARLARLELTPDEVVRYTDDLANILTLVEQLDALDLAGVSVETSPEEAQAVPTVFREDRGVREFDRDTLLAIAPCEEDGFYRVPRILADDAE